MHTYFAKTKRKEKIFLWGICVLLLFGYWLVFHPDQLCGDAESYWARSMEFVAEGQFSFSNYSSLLRGYVFPFLLFIQRGFGLLPAGIDMYLWAVTFAMMIDVIVVYQLPWFSRNLFGKEMTKTKILWLMILLCIFWQGNLLYPLSDFYAVFFLNFSVILLYRLNRLRLGDSWVKSGLTAFIMGICIYITYSIRAMYVFFAFAIFFVFFLKNIKKNVKKTVLISAITLAGCLFVSVPQIMINITAADTWSPLVLGEREGEKINDKQLFWGLYYSRYETYVGDYEIYPYAGVIFEDEAGKAIIEKENLEDLTPFQAIKLYLKYPFDVIGIYGRHVLNAMDNRFPELYITDLYKSRLGYMFGNYLIWFMFFTFWSVQERAKGKAALKLLARRWQYICLMIISSLVMIAGAVEIRFFLPIYCLMYMYVLMNFSKETIFKCYNKYGIWLGVFAVIGFGMYVIFSGNTMASIYDGIPVLF